MSTLRMSALRASSLKLSGLQPSSHRPAGPGKPGRHDRYDRLLEILAAPDRLDPTADGDAAAVHQAVTAPAARPLAHRAVQQSACPVRQMLHAALRVLRETRRVWRLPLA